MKLGLILATIPVLKEWLYAPSFDLIRLVQSYQTPEFNSFMNFVSAMADGEFYFYLIIGMAMIGRTYEFYFFTIVASAN